MLTDYIQARFDVTFHGDEMSLACPLCSDHKRRLYINSANGRWMCFNCMEAGGIYTLLEKLCNLDPFEAYRVGQKLQASLPKPHHDDPPKVADAPPEPVGIIMDNENDPLQRPFWEYAIGRGLTPSEIVKLGLRYSLAGVMRGRLVFPVFMQRQLRTWAGRAIGNLEPKWLYWAGPKTSELLYGLDEVRSREGVILTEGIFDAHRLWGQAVATFGAHLSPTQRDILRQEKFRCITFLYDGDEAGWRAAKRHGKELFAAGFTVRIARLPPGTDPATVNQYALIKALADAITLPHTFIGRSFTQGESQ